MRQPARLGLTLKTTTRLAPQLHQALSLLQLNQTQLEDHIRECLESNPTLEWDPSAGHDKVDIATWASQPLSLADHLIGQLALLALPTRQYQLAEAVIRGLDERGYVADALSEIADSADLTPAATEQEVAHALTVVQQLEPAGIAATSLRDCLIRQLQQRPSDPAHTLAARILDQAHEALTHLDLEAIAKQCQVDVTQLRPALQCLQQLDPAPGLQWTDQRQHHLTPDVRFHEIGGQWRVEVHPGSHPSLSISSHYQNLAKTAKGGDKRYLHQALQQARDLIDGLQLRSQTLHRVAAELAARQTAFLTQGRAALQPLSQAELAQHLALHPSTISRAIRGKYALTPHGITALRDMFSVGLPSSAKPVSAAAAEAMIGALITSESSVEPWSDQQLADQLCQQGLPLSRRTVAKYRQRLGIPGSSQRRRLRHFHPLAHRSRIPD